LRRSETECSLPTPAPEERNRLAPDGSPGCKAEYDYAPYGRHAVRERGGWLASRTPPNTVWQKRTGDAPGLYRLGQGTPYPPDLLESEV